MAEKIVQTAGRDQLGEFAPMFAHLNDDVLFGEVWNEEAISVKQKCIITVVSLMASGITDSSLVYHLQNAKAHGVTKEEIAAIITHATMYVGWPKGWAVFRLAKEVWTEEDAPKEKCCCCCKDDKCQFDTVEEYAPGWCQCGPEHPGQAAFLPLQSL